jgi:hypothetical protein
VEWCQTILVALLAGPLVAGLSGAWGLVIGGHDGLGMGAIVPGGGPLPRGA